MSHVIVSIVSSVGVSSVSECVERVKCVECVECTSRHAPKCERRGTLRVMLPGGLGDAGQAGDCVKQFQYVYRVFEHCRVRQATRRVGGGGSNPEPHTVFF